MEDHKPLLKNVLRVVYFSWLKKTMAEKGVRLQAIGGGEDHVHLLVQLHPAQNLMQVVRQLKDESLSFIGSNHFSALANEGRTDVAGVEMLYVVLEPS
ncbi:MAG: hypothetical protein EAZ17_00875, partial [Sphingobacteriales bacterium]